MNRELKNIFETYDNFQNNKKIISEILVTPNDVSYSRIKFAPRTKSDQINKALLDDLQSAANAAGVVISVDFAKTGHRKGPSRHMSNSAVDIDTINGKTVSWSNKALVDK